MVAALGFARAKIRLHRSTKPFTCYCPGRLHDAEFYPRAGEVECGHSDCDEVISPGEHYVRDHHVERFGDPVCLRCATALWAPPLSQVDDLVAQRQARLRSAVEAMWENINLA